MAHGAHALTHDDAHGGIENRLTALLAALTASLAPLVLNTAENVMSGLGGIRGGRWEIQDGAASGELAMASRVNAWTANQKAPFRLPARPPEKSL